MNPKGGQEWVETLLYILARLVLALWILAALLAALIRRPKRDRKQLTRRVNPSRDSVQDLAIALRTSQKSAITRDRIASRLRALAYDLATLEPGNEAGSTSSPKKLGESSRDELLHAYFEEYRLAFSLGKEQKAERALSFLANTKQVVSQLDAIRTNTQGDN